MERIGLSIRRLCFPETPTFSTLAPSDKVLVRMASRAVFAIALIPIAFPIFDRIGVERALYYLVPIALLAVLLLYQRILEWTAKAYKAARRKRYPRE